MPGDTCVVCGKTRASDRNVSFHRFPANPEKRAVWLRVFELDESDLKPYSRVCSRHFPDDDAKKEHGVNLGKRFASPKKRDHPRAKRAKRRDSVKELLELRVKSPTESPSTSRLVTPTVQISTSATESGCSTPTTVPAAQPPDTEVLVNTALFARVEALEAENSHLKRDLDNCEKKREYFRLELVKHDDKLIRFYTGFVSYAVFLSFFDFLGPVVNELHYQGEKGGKGLRRVRMLDPINQLFLTLVKLKLNLKLKDLAFRFVISPSVVSRYINTWICFLYHHLKEIDWTPSVNQVISTLPHSLKKLYPNTFAIIDGSEIFLETPSDLCMQSFTRSQYKHQNMAKFLVACTPNGAISFVSPVFVGSISDVELTRESGFLTTLQDKPGISIMADRGFTIKDMLKDIGIELNIPPFMEGCAQLPVKEVQEGRRIASVRIHVERAIGRMKNFAILQGTFPIRMSRIINQVVCVCAFLTNFMPALVPPPENLKDEVVDNYFQGLSSDSEYDEVSEDEELED